MLGWLFRTDSSKWKALDKALTRSFLKVKGEIEALFSWVSHFQRLHAQNSQEHSKFQLELEHNASRTDLLEEEVELLKKELESLQGRSGKNQVRTRSELKSEPEPKYVPEPRLKTTFEENILNEIMPNRKKFILQQIIKLIDKGDLSTKQIEHIIVREKRYCGRTTFYAYLKELRDRRIIPEKIGSE